MSNFSNLIVYSLLNFPSKLQEQKAALAKMVFSEEGQR